MATDKETQLQKLYKASLSSRTKKASSGVEADRAFLKSMSQKSTAVGGTAKKEENPPSFIEGLIHVLEGPMQGMYKTSGLSQFAGGKEEAMDLVSGKSAQKNIGERLLTGLTPGGPLVWNTLDAWFNPNAKKVYGNQIIEGVADTVNTSQGRDTFQEENTVDPVTKGVAGFVMDVAADPLTYVPGAALAKPLAKGAQVARKALKLPAKGASPSTGRTIDQAAKAAQDLAPEATVAATRAANEAEQAAEAAARQSQTADDIATEATEQLSDPKVSRETSKAFDAGASVDEVAETVAQATRDSKAAVDEAIANGGKLPTLGERLAPDLKKTKSFLERLRKEFDKANNITAAVKTVDKGFDLKKTNTRLDDGRRVGFLKPFEWVEDLGTSFKFGGQTYFPTQISKYLREGTFEQKIPKPLQQQIITGYNDFAAAYKKAYDEGFIYTLDGDRIPISEVAGAKATTPAQQTLLDMFKKKMDESERFSQQAMSLLGKSLTQTMEGLRSPKKFESLMQDIGQLADGVDINTFRSMDTMTPGAQAYLISKGVTDKDLLDNYLALRDELAGVDPDLAAKAAENAGADVRELMRKIGIPFKQFINDIDEAFKYFTTGKGTAKTNKKLGKGRAVQRNQLNQYAQLNVLNGIFKYHSPQLFSPTKIKKNASFAVAEKLYGSGRSVEMRLRAMDDLKIWEDFLDESGIPTFFFYGDHLVPIRLGQAMEIFLEKGGPLAERLLFNGKTLIPPTKFAEAIAYLDTVPLGKAVDEEELRRILQSTDTLNTNGKSIANMLNPEVKGDRVVRHHGKKTEPNPANLIEGDFVEKHFDSAGNLVGYWVLTTPEDLTNLAVKFLLDSRKPLAAAISAAKARYATRLSIESSALTDDEMALILQAWEGGGNAALLEKLATSKSDIAAKAQATGSMPQSAGVAAKTVEANVAEPVMKQAETMVPAAKKAEAEEKKSKLLSPEKQVKAAEKPLREAAQKNADETWDKYLPDDEVPTAKADEPPKYDLSYASANIGAALEDTFLQRVYFKVNRMFNAKAFIDEFWHLQHGPAGVASSMNRVFDETMQKYARKYNRITLTTAPNVKVGEEALRYVQKGERPPAGMNPTDAARLNEAIDEMEEIWKFVFSTDDPRNGLLASDYFRNGGGFELINNSLAHMGAGAVKNKTGVITELAEEPKLFQFLPDEARDAHVLSGRTVYDELILQIQNWDFGEYPLENLRKVQAAFSQALTYSNIADSLQVYAARVGAYSKTPKPGWMQPAASKKSVVIQGLDPEGYYPVEFLEKAGATDEFLQQTRTLNSDFGKFLNTTLDPALDAWKFGVTVTRPGHHIRNMVGDMSITFSAEGMRYTRKATVDAFRILAYKLSDPYDMTDYLAALNKLEPGKTANADDVLASVSMKNGKKEDIRISEVREEMEKRALYPGFGVSEDILGEGTGPFAKFARAVSLQTRFTEKYAGGVSQYRDHLARTHHFMQFVRKNSKKYATKEALYDAAAKQVIKYHPDGSILSSFEARYMRRAIPFYTWFRGILPGAIEVTLTHPGRFMVFPKASYNLAVAMGVDPQSLSNPYPDDQLFPSFIRDDVFGPQFILENGDYLRSNPGFAQVDLLNTFGNNPIKGIIGSLNPMYKLPFELNNMKRLDSGTNINDLSDYLDSQIPHVSYLSNITGTSFTGTLSNLLQAKPKLDPKYQFERGNQDILNQILSLTNWGTGMGVQDLSAPNLINYAELEKRNRAIEERRQEGQ